MKAPTEMVCFVMKRAESMRTVSKFKSLHVFKDRVLLPHGGMLGVEGSDCSDRSPLIKALCIAMQTERASPLGDARVRRGKGAERNVRS